MSKDQIERAQRLYRRMPGAVQPRNASRISGVECPNCRGQGVTRGPQSNMPWSDCVWCKGTGVVSEEDALAHGGEP